MTRKLILSTLLWVLVAASSASTGMADDQDAKQILQRAIKAVGGASSLNRLKSPMMWMERGTFYGMGEGAPYVGQYASKWPDWYRQEIENAFAITVNGKSAWVSSANGVKNLAGAQLDEQLKQVRVAWAVRLFPLTGEAYELSTMEGPEVNGRATVGIKAAHSDGRDIKLFFDKQTFLIAKSETMVISPQSGPEPVLSETFYTDHKSFAGVIMPSKYKLYYGEKLFVEGETVDYKIGATLDPKHFEPPEPN
jgi:hypothetical protein